ncbi:MAG: hypothetical protein KDF60_06770 [Calditrichaeota bacterium]|nr:hypothetical protein [Calditrichota bacterium]
MQKLTIIERQLNRISNKTKLLEKQSNKFSWYRLASIIIALVFGVLALIYSSNLLAGIAIGIVLFIFGTLSFFHGRIKNAISRFEKLFFIYTLNKNRLGLNWNEIPESNFNADGKHPYGFDLDIYGTASLLRLIDQTTTLSASKRLSDWLLQPGLEPEEILERQHFVKALKKKTTLRNRILLFGLSVKSTLQKTDTTILQNWFKNNKIKISGWYNALVSVTAIFNIALFLLHQVQWLKAYWIYTFLFYIVLHLVGQLKINALFSGIFNLADDIRRYERILHYIEQFHFQATSSLSNLVKKIQDKDSRPSKQLKRLNMLISAIGLRMNPVMAVILNVAVPWDYFIAGMLQKRIPHLNTALNEWLDEFVTLDAFSSLAQFAWLHDNYTFPQINPNLETQPDFEAASIGHPLLHSQNRKSNTFKIDKNNHLTLITGSNMSGKSTFLRTIGLNLVLAYAGAPVCAEKLNTKIFRIQSCIRISDSLSEGLSYFYAEVRRLKQILNAIDENNSLPVLFLVDEIFKGTNNRERLIGSRAYIKELSKKSAIGIISTHDLELAHLDREISNLQNFHFKEDIVNGKMHFDYTINVGPSPTTNALKIMELEGLPVDKKHNTVVS